jgi:hypothetical protein
LVEFKVVLFKGMTMEDNDVEKKTYEEPTLVKREVLKDVTEGAGTVTS